MSRTVIILSLAVLFIVCSALLFLPDYDSPGMVKFLIISQVLFGLSIGVFLAGRRLDFDLEYRKLFLALVALAMLARAVMFVGAGDKCYLSDDVYRYIWDGKVAAHGISPFLYAPTDARLAHLADTVIHPEINHPSVPTIYPPMAQNIFVLSYLIGGDTIWGFKAIAVLFELMTILALMIWLRQMGLPRANLLLWLFSPLILIEFYLSTHLDMIALPFLVGSLITLNQKRPGLCGMMLAMATLVKFYGLFFVPFLLLHFTGRDRSRFVVGFAVTAIGLYLPYLFAAGTSVFGSLFRYLGEWQFNGSVFYLLKYGFGLDSARWIVSILFFVWLLWLLWRPGKVLDRMFRALAGYVVLTTTLYPWYLVWIFPFVLRNLAPAFLFLSGSIFLSYHVLIGQYEIGRWVVIPWLGVAAYIPFYLLLIMGAIRNRKVMRTDG